MTIKKNYRVEKVRNDISVAMSKVFVEDISNVDNFFDGYMISLVDTKISTDLKLCNFFISSIKLSDFKDYSKESVSQLNINKKKIRFLLTQKINLKFSPEIRFLESIKDENIQKLKKIFKSISEDNK